MNLQQLCCEELWLNGLGSSSHGLFAHGSNAFAPRLQVTASLNVQSLLVILPFAVEFATHLRLHSLACLGLSSSSFSTIMMDPTLSAEQGQFFTVPILGQGPRAFCEDAR